MLGGFQKQMAVHRRRETGDDDRRHILQRKLALAFRRLAGQLPIPATNRTLWAVYADDVIGHAGEAIPVMGTLTIASPSLISVERRTLILCPSVLF